MATYTFALSTSDDARQAGIIQSASFEDALRIVGERMTVNRGAKLELGVHGFPPARYECVESTLEGAVFWQPDGHGQLATGDGRLAAELAA